MGAICLMGEAGAAELRLDGQRVDDETAASELVEEPSRGMAIAERSDRKERLRHEQTQESSSGS